MIGRRIQVLGYAQPTSCSYHPAKRGGDRCLAPPQSLGYVFPEVDGHVLSRHPGGRRIRSSFVAILLLRNHSARRSSASVGNGSVARTWPAAQRRGGHHAMRSAKAIEGRRGHVLVAALLGTAAIGCAGAEAGGGTGEETARLDTSALAAATANDWPQFQHDAVHSGIDAARPGSRPPGWSILCEPPSSSTTAARVTRRAPSSLAASSMWLTSVPIQTSPAASPRSTWRAAAALPPVDGASRSGRASPAVTSPPLRR